MQQQQQGRLRSFVQTPVGKALLIAVTIGVVFATAAYVDVLIAIPAMLLFGLAVPIWSGLKAPRYLALSALVVLLVVAPIGNVVLTQDIMTPIGASTSPNSGSAGNGPPVLQNALVTPYTGGTATNFTWEVTVFPQELSAGNSSPMWLTLYISNCPGATGNSSPFCPSGYPLIILNNTAIGGIKNETNTTFHYQIGTTGIWDWQMSLTVSNTTTHALYYIFLVGDPMYNGIEGPVVGSFSQIYFSLVSSLYIEYFLYLGAPFYFVLLIYMIYKRREQRKADAARRAAGPTPADETGPSSPIPAKMGGPPTPPYTSPASPKEGSCPNCGAVVYAGEKTCWKCGATLGAAASGAPLPTSGKP
ncbi:MAG: hypothetical protein WB873_08270 [Thermoplasmata archaeon]